MDSANKTVTTAPPSPPPTDPQQQNSKPIQASTGSPRAQDTKGPNDTPPGTEKPLLAREASSSSASNSSSTSPTKQWICPLLYPKEPRIEYHVGSKGEVYIKLKVEPLRLQSDAALNE